jgi:hypothetical protein
MLEQSFSGPKSSSIVYRSRRDRKEGACQRLSKIGQHCVGQLTWSHFYSHTKTVSLSLDEDTEADAKLVAQVPPPSPPPDFIINPQDSGKPLVFVH